MQGLKSVARSDMRRTLKALVTTAFGIVIAMGPSVATLGQSDGLSIQFIGSDWFVNDTVVTGTSPGHAFLCMRYMLKQGVKEDCWGFYPKNALAYVYGPGIVDSEFGDSHD